MGACFCHDSMLAAGQMDTQNCDFLQIPPPGSGHLTAMWEVSTYNPDSGVNSAIFLTLIPTFSRCWDQIHNFVDLTTRQVQRKNAH